MVDGYVMSRQAARNHNRLLVKILIPGVLGASDADTDY